MTDDLPLTFGRPIARGAGRCHVLALEVGAGTMVAVCGRSCGTFCGEASFEDGMTSCPHHAEALCAECTEILDTFATTGRWEGVIGNPENVGVRFTVCLDPHCPETIPVRPCWCWEHLERCREPDCDHGGHLCEAPVHWCESHAWKADG